VIKNVKNSILVSKNVEYDADFKFVEKVAETHATKFTNEKVTEICSFLL
jgi:hypothetical protein